MDDGFVPKQCRLLYVYNYVIASHCEHCTILIVCSNRKLGEKNGAS